jgi:hypothetical protein
MPTTDLDDRLRRALSSGREPAATDEAMGAIVSGLPRYRSRRRAVMGASGASALGVLGLTLALVLAGPGRPATTTAEPPGHAPSARAEPAPSCVQVLVGTGSASCTGEIASGPANGPLAAGTEAAPGQGAAFGTATTLPNATIAASAGERVVVSLPAEAGFSWNRVTVTDLAAPGGGRRLTPRLDGATGRAVAVVSHARAGEYAVVATGSVSCTSDQSCTSTAYRWSITLNVR